MPDMTYNHQPVDSVFSLYVFGEYQSALIVTGDPLPHQSFGFSGPQGIGLIDSLVVNSPNSTSDFNFHVMNNIDVANYDYDGYATPANIKTIDGTYRGYFDGGGYTFSNSNSVRGGLFDTLGAGATIANLNINRPIINQSLLRATGGISNNVSGNASLRSVSVTNSPISSLIDIPFASGGVGGLIGRATVNGLVINIADSYTTGTINTSSNANSVSAGLLGSSLNASIINITNSYSTMDITATTTSDGSITIIGGLIGDAGNTPIAINNSYYYGALQAKNPSQTGINSNGGLIGYASTTPVINNSFAYMTSQSNENNRNATTGGLVGSAVTLANGNKTYYSPNINTATGNPASTNITK